MYDDKELSLQFSVPKNFAHQQKDEEGMYFGYGETSQYGHFTIQEYNNIPPPSSCSPDTLGDDAPHWTPLEHIVQTHDAQRDILTITAMQPPEPPPVEMEPQRLQEWKENERYRYLFCSAHKGKAVKIVITQVKDNPTLAQKIFETFRWKE